MPHNYFVAVHYTVQTATGSKAGYNEVMARVRSKCFGDDEAIQYLKFIIEHRERKQYPNETISIAYQLFEIIDSRAIDAIRTIMQAEYDGWNPLAIGPCNVRRTTSTGRCVAYFDFNLTPTGEKVKIHLLHSKYGHWYAPIRKNKVISPKAQMGLHLMKQRVQKGYYWTSGLADTDIQWVLDIVENEVAS